MKKYQLKLIYEIFVHIFLYLIFNSDSFKPDVNKKRNILTEQPSFSCKRYAFSREDNCKLQGENLGLPNADGHM